MTGGAPTCSLGRWLMVGNGLDGRGLMRVRRYWKKQIETWMEGQKTMNNQYESLYLRSKEQDKTTAFAHFNLAKTDPEAGTRTFDPWLPFKQLAELAEPEPWQSDEMENGQRKFPVGNFEILASYLNFTFMRLQEEDKVLYSNDGKRACFNTGLLDRKFGEDILAFFAKNTNGQGNQDWFFLTFSTRPEAERRHWLDGFPGDPDVAEYYNAANYRDLFFDLDYPTIVVAVHVVEENANRLPPTLRSDPHQAHTLILGAVGKLYTRLRRNYKLAVPHWHDRHIQLLLPLCLSGSRKADLALVVERNDERKCYVAMTILTLDMAYKDARLICRPDSEWLKG